MTQDQAFQEQLLNMFKTAVEGTDYKTAARYYLAMTQFTEADAEMYFLEKQALIKNRLKLLYETDPGKEIQKLAKEEDWLLETYGKLFAGELYHQVKKLW